MRPRELLRQTVAGAIERLWPNDASQAPSLGGSEISQAGRRLYARILELSPANDRERATQSQALQLAASVGHTRLLLIAEQESAALSGVFLFVLSLWLVVLFASFGLFAPRNALVVATLLISALSVSAQSF